MMNISKFFCMLIAGLAIIGFTTVGMASEHPTAEASKAIDSKEEHPKSEESKAESKAEIQYGAKPEFELESGEKEAKTEEKE